MHPTKIKVLRAIEQCAELGASEIAAKVGICADRAREISNWQADQRYIEFRLKERPGRGRLERIYSRTSVEIPVQELEQPPKKKAAKKKPRERPEQLVGAWWPAADQAVVQAMRSMVSVGRAVA
jgi:hypothetical protein